MIKQLMLGSLLLLAGGFTTRAGGNAATTQATGEITATADKFLATLSDEQRGKVLFKYTDAAQRKRWSNFPTSFVKRGGLRMGDLTAAQREAVMALLKVA